MNVSFNCPCKFVCTLITIYIANRRISNSNLRKQNKAINFTRQIRINLKFSRAPLLINLILVQQLHVITRFIKVHGAQTTTNHQHITYE